MGVAFVSKAPTFQLASETPFAGPASPKLEQVWSELLKNASIRWSSAELVREIPNLSCDA